MASDGQLDLVVQSLSEIKVMCTSMQASLVDFGQRLVGIETWRNEHSEFAAQAEQRLRDAANEAKAAATRLEQERIRPMENDLQQLKGAMGAFKLVGGLLLGLLTVGQAIIYFKNIMGKP